MSNSSKRTHRVNYLQHSQIVLLFEHTQIAINRGWDEHTLILLSPLIVNLAYYIIHAHIYAYTQTMTTHICIFFNLKMDEL